MAGKGLKFLSSSRMPGSKNSLVTKSALDLLTTDVADIVAQVEEKVSVLDTEIRFMGKHILKSKEENEKLWQEIADTDEGLEELNAKVEINDQALTDIFKNLLRTTAYLTYLSLPWYRRLFRKPPSYG